MSTNQTSSTAAPGGIALPPFAIVSDEVRAAAERLSVGQYLDEVVAFTVEIFDSFSEVEVVPDPEIPGYEQIIFNVPVTGSVDEILEKDRRWARRLLATIPRAPRVYSFLMDYYE